MKSKITCLMLFTALLLFLIPTNIFAQATFVNSDLSKPMFSDGMWDFVIGIICSSCISQVFGFVNYELRFSEYGFDGFTVNFFIPIGLTYDYSGKESVRFYIFTPIMAGKYAKYSPRIELINSLSILQFTYSIFVRNIFPINIKENLFSIQPFIGAGFITDADGHFLIDTDVFFQISIITLGVNYQIAIGEYTFSKLLFNLSIYF